MSAAAAGALVSRILLAIASLDPKVLSAVADFVEGLREDNATKSRRAAGLATARAHQAAVEAAVQKAKREAAQRMGK